MKSNEKTNKQATKHFLHNTEFLKEKRSCTFSSNTKLLTGV